MCAGSRSNAGGAKPPSSSVKNTANIDIFTKITPFRRNPNGASGQIDENGSLPYKPRQLSAMTRSDRGGSFGPETAYFGPASITGLNLNYQAKLPGQRRTTREADLSTQQTGAQAPPRLPRSHGDQRRTQDRCRAPRARTQAAQRLNSRRGAARPWSGSGIAPIFWPPRAEPKSQLRRSCCRRASEPRAVRSASASPCREKLEPPSSAIGCGAGSKKS